MFRVSLLFLTALIALLAGGCAVGPDYRAPMMPIEEGFGQSVQATTQPSMLTTGPVAQARWWETLCDPELDRLMSDVVGSNLDVKIARSRVRQARAELAYASGGQYPTADVSTGYSHERLSKTAAPYNAFDVPGFPWEYDQYQVGFDATWELDVFGSVRRGVEAAKADAAASAADQRDVLLSVMAELARNYVDLRGYQRRYEIAQGNLQNQQTSYDIAEDRQKQGVVAELDVARAMSQVARTRSQLPVLKQKQLEAMHRIAVLLGRQPKAMTDELSKSQPVPVPPPEIAIGVPAELLRRRPDIRRAERELAAATARIGQATADLYPRFSLTGNFAMMSAGTQDLFDWRSHSFGVGPTVSWPIFDAGRLRSLVDMRHAEQEQSLAKYERTVLGALEETHNAMVAFAAEQERHAALAGAVAADQTAADVAQAQYKQGVVDFLNVLDAQRSLFESEDQLADSGRMVTTSMVALYKALGGGWDVNAPPQPQAPNATARAVDPSTEAEIHGLRRGVADSANAAQFTTSDSASHEIMQR